MEGDAARYEARYTEAFQRRMHRPTLGELAAAAASTFLPLSALRRVGAAHGHGTAPSGLRARAVLAALAGRFDEADSLFAEGGAVLDAKYRASLAALRGDVAEAVRRFVATVADDAADVRVLTYLLAEVEADSALLAPLSEEPLRGAVSASLDQALAARPLRAPLWRSLATFHRLLDEHDEAGRCADRARVLEDAAARDARPVGRVLAAAVYHFVGKAKGLVHQIWVDRVPAAPGQGGFLQPEDVFGNITPELKASVRNIFFAVREYTRSRFPHRTADILDYDYAYKVTKEDEPSGGLSAGLATALGFLSVFLQEPVPQDVAFSGVVIADSHDVLVVRHVAEVEFKVKAAYNRNLRRILLPRDNRVDVRDNPRLPRALTEGLVGYVASLDEAVTEVWGAGVWTR
jgi:hypothetical protein